MNYLLDSDKYTKLRERIDNGEKNTLLCYEKKPLFYYRRLLNNLI